jgi:hypothetical protein
MLGRMSRTGQKSPKRSKTERVPARTSTVRNDSVLVYRRDRYPESLGDTAPRARIGEPLRDGGTGRRGCSLGLPKSVVIPDLGRYFCAEWTPGGRLPKHAHRAPRPPPRHRCLPHSRTLSAHLPTERGSHRGVHQGCGDPSPHGPAHPRIRCTSSTSRSHPRILRHANGRGRTRTKPHTVRRERRTARRVPPERRETRRKGAWARDSQRNGKSSRSGTPAGRTAPESRAGSSGRCPWVPPPELHPLLTPRSPCLIF